MSGTDTIRTTIMPRNPRGLLACGVDGIAIPKGIRHVRFADAPTIKTMTVMG